VSDGPRCCLCPARGEPCQDAPTIYVCSEHAARPREERVAAFQKLVKAQEERERNGDR